ncbi:GNAT family N-acetyltransferase [Actinomadura rudentiformis]|uniref:GNAT family N-acetyltransferase n=1 Tax=Actinomadura rudentiformis TaxID=359158 RepID=A0A6H9YYW7_9ACTN|nr:GNAT family N-acetyltransferase [Actinomadura rudentiformis]
MLREVSDSDLGALLRWRNHPEVRKASFTTHEIGEAEHRRWWSRVCADPTRRVLIYEHRSTPCGVVTFSGLDGAEAWWGFYLDLDGLGESGELLHAWLGLEKAAIAHAFGPLGLRVLRGEVLAANEAVLRFHRRCGFTESGRHVREIDGEEQVVVHMELRRGR